MIHRTLTFTKNTLLNGRHNLISVNINRYQPINSQLKIRLNNVRNYSSSANSSKQGANKMEGSYHWYLERALSTALIPLFATSFFYGSLPANDYALGIVLPIHIHMGLSSVIIDYLPFRRFPIIHCLALIGQHTATFYSLYGAYIINSRDIGLTEYFKRIWKA